MKIVFGLFYLPACVLFPALCLAQNIDTTLGKVTYQERFAFSGDPSQTDLQYLTKTMTLYFGKTTAIYLSEVKTNTMPRMVIYQGKDSTKVDKNAVMQKVENQLSAISIPSSGTQVYKSYNSPLLSIHQTSFGEEYLITDTLNAIAWDIKAETKNIASFECRKAIGSFRGRTYTAWFTTDIPVSTGPWKLHGLPGLILEAEDAKKEVIFTVTNISIPPPEKMPINGNFSGRKVSRAQFRKESTQRLQNRQNMASSSSSQDVRYNVSTRKVVSLELDPVQ